MFFGQFLHHLSSSTPFSFLAAVSLFYVCKLLLLLGLLTYHVHQIPHIGETMCYFSFIDWHNSLSIIFSSSISAVTKCKGFFFFYRCVVFHCINIPQLFIPSSTDGHLDCFQIFAIVNSSAINIGLHIEFYWSFQTLGVFYQKWDTWVKKEFHL